MKKCLWVMVLLALLYAHDGHGLKTLSQGDDGKGEIGIDERTGQFLPPELVLRDEKGNGVKLGELFAKPVILTLVYYTCDNICPLMLSGLSQALPRLATAAGKDYRTVTVSFDEMDTPEIARTIKKNYTRAVGSAFPEEGWNFLTGDRQTIQRLTQAAGFRFRRDSRGFSHPTALIILAPGGKISRYLPVTKYQYGADYPISFSSFELNMALAEATQGKAVSGFRKTLLYCFSHEPPGQSKFFNFMAAVGIITLLAMVAFFVYLQVSSRKYRKGIE